MKRITPNKEWYTTVSQKKRVLPRCQFASTHRCPQFYTSLWCVGEAGISTQIAPDEDKGLLEKWRQSDVWPALSEQEPCFFGSEGYTSFSKFCPEVSYEIFGLFASAVLRYSDEDGIDKAFAHQLLQKENAPPDDWGWNWLHVTPMHYTDCPLYSLLHQPTHCIPKKRSIGYRTNEQKQ